MRKIILVMVGALAAAAVMTTTAIAARHYLITTTSQIKPSVLAKLHGATGPAGAPGQTGGPGQQGVQGPQGAQGLQGPPGPAGQAGNQGPTGPAGPSGGGGTQGAQGPAGGFDLTKIHYRVSPGYTAVAIDGQAHTLAAGCNDGEYILSGGVNGYGIQINSSWPQHNWQGPSPSDDVWFVNVTGIGPYGANAQVYAICASS